MKTAATKQKPDHAEAARAPAKSPFEQTRVESLVGNFAMQRAVQASLSVGGGGDKFEEEADRVAETAAGPAPEIERREDEELRVQTKRDAGAAAPKATESVERFLGGARGGGTSLPASMRTLAESRLRHDFSNVRVHTDANAASAARSFGAEAFTYGSDIYFARGRYQPTSVAGQKLLAHELTHVVQQGAAAPALQRKAANDHDEVEADPDEGGAAASGQEGVTINRPGVMACTPASPETQYLRKIPSPEAGTNVIETLSFNQRVLVEQRGGAGNAWYQIFVGAGQHGWVPAASVALDPPEPNAILYRVQPGDTPMGLVGAWYWDGRWGNWIGTDAPGGDARFYVGALAYANKGRAGMLSPEALTERPAWKSVTLTAGHTIWRPSKAFLQTLRGKISSGSITTEVWEAVKVVAIYMAGFVAGILYGAYEAIEDLLTGVVGLIKMLWDIVKSVIEGTILSDAAAWWEQLKKLKISDLETWFLSKWNAADPWDQAFFRGRVVGYVIMEILMALFSGAILNAIKWVGKFAKIGALIAKLPGIVKGIETAQKALKLPEKIIKEVKAARAAKAAAKEKKAAEAAAKATRIRASTMHHVFSQKRHKLDDLVTLFGSEDKAFDAVQKATNAAVKSQRIDGVFEVAVKVGTEAITVRGSVIDGIVRISTFFKP